MLRTPSCNYSYEEEVIRKILKEGMFEVGLEEGMGTSQAAIGGEGAQETFFKH